MMCINPRLNNEGVFTRPEWRDVVTATPQPVQNALLAELNAPPAQYLFRVAAINGVGTGRFSPSTEPMTMTPSGNTSLHFLSNDTIAAVTVTATPTAAALVGNTAALPGQLPATPSVATATQPSSQMPASPLNIPPAAVATPNTTFGATATTPQMSPIQLQAQMQAQNYYTQMWQQMQYQQYYWQQYIWQMNMYNSQLLQSMQTQPAATPPHNQERSDEHEHAD